MKQSDYPRFFSLFLVLENFFEPPGFSRDKNWKAVNGTLSIQFLERFFMPSSSYKSKQMIVIRRDLKMRKGKIAAQASHACVEATLMALAKEHRLNQVRVTDDQNWVYLDHTDEDTSAITNWFDAGVAKVCVYVDSEEELLELAAEGKARGFVVALIKDAGFTEFHGEPTFTCLAFEPLAAEDIDPLTGELPLY